MLHGVYRLRPGASDSLSGKLRTKVNCDQLALQRISIMPQRSLLMKVTRSIRKRGAIKTAVKIFRYPFNSRIRERHCKDVYNSSSVEERFTKIFVKKLWGDDESLSGVGSSLEHTENIRRYLPELINAYSIKSMFDAPCGDFNWMKYVLDEVKVRYIGGDVVKPLIDKNNLNYRNLGTSFIHFDIIEGKFPQADLWICRDCLFHLSFDDTFKALERFIESGIPYVLTTTNKNVDGFKNVDIQSGSWRLIDLFSEPYCFDKKVLFRIDDWVTPHPPREMCLWSREQIVNSIGKGNFRRGKRKPIESAD